MKLTLESKYQPDLTPTLISPDQKRQVLMTPPINDEYWLFRVKLLKDQAIVGFPKFCTIGIGFAIEKDWNSNLPYSCDAEKIYDHIKHNKKYRQITKADCISAIKMVQTIAKRYIEEKKQNIKEQS